MEHKLLEHEQGCRIKDCIICVQGVCHCTVCEGTESSLTTHCVGKRLLPNQQTMIANDALDFKNGKWVNNG